MQRDNRIVTIQTNQQQLGLRERQRARRHFTILSAAAALFSSKGFAETTIEDIATQAGVSPPTIYNYFRSKNEILLGLLEYDKEEVESALDAILANPVGDAVEVLTEFVCIDLGSGSEVGNKALWRLISAAALETTDERRQDYLQTQLVFTFKLHDLILQLMRDGRIAAGIDVMAAARLVNAVTRDGFRQYINNDTMTAAEMIARVRGQIGVLWTGLRPV